MKQIKIALFLVVFLMMNSSAFAAEKGIHEESASETIALNVYNNLIKPVNNTNSTIYCDLNKSGRLTLKIYDAKGYKVVTLADRDFDAGSHSFTWDGRNNVGAAVRSGIYFVFMTAHMMREYQKICVIR